MLRSSARCSAGALSEAPRVLVDCDDDDGGDVIKEQRGWLHEEGGRNGGTAITHARYQGDVTTGGTNEAGGKPAVHMEVTRLTSLGISSQMCQCRLVHDGRLHSTADAEQDETTGRLRKRMSVEVHEPLCKRISASHARTRPRKPIHKLIKAQNYVKSNKQNASNILTSTESQNLCRTLGVS